MQNKTRWKIISEVLFITVLCLLLFCWFIYYQTRTPLSLGMDGPYYELNIKSLITQGHFFYQSQILTFLIIILFVKVIGQIALGIKFATAFFAVILLLSVYLFVRKLSKKIIPAIFSVIFICTTMSLYFLMCGHLKQLFALSILIMAILTLHIYITEKKKLYLALTFIGTIAIVFTHLPTTITLCITLIIYTGCVFIWKLTKKEFNWQIILIVFFLGLAVTLSYFASNIIAKDLSTEPSKMTGTEQLTKTLESNTVFDNRTVNIRSAFFQIEALALWNMPKPYLQPLQPPPPPEENRKNNEDNFRGDYFSGQTEIQPPQPDEGIFQFVENFIIFLIMIIPIILGLIYLIINLELKYLVILSLFFAALISQLTAGQSWFIRFSWALFPQLAIMAGMGIAFILKGIDYNLKKKNLIGTVMLIIAIIIFSLFNCGIFLVKFRYPSIPGKYISPVQGPSLSKEQYDDLTNIYSGRKSIFDRGIIFSLETPPFWVSLVTSSINDAPYPENILNQIEKKPNFTDAFIFILNKEDILGVEIENKLSQLLEGKTKLGKPEIITKTANWIVAKIKGRNLRELALSLNREEIEKNKSLMKSIAELPSPLYNPHLEDYILAWPLRLYLGTKYDNYLRFALFCGLTGIYWFLIVYLINYLIKKLKK